jgi:autotransporter-associated beta strand protein
VGLVGYVALALSAAAADFTWLNTPASGNWNETDANWSGAGSVWANAPANSAVFGASETTAVAADAVTLQHLTINADGYAISGGPLLMYGSPTIGAGQTATLNATVTNVGVWTKGGGGTLVLSPGADATNTFYALKAMNGRLHVANGTTLVTQSGSNPESGPAFWVSGGTLVIDGGLLKTTGGMYARVSDYGTLLVTNGLVDLTGNAELLNAFNTPGVTTVSGSGVLDVQRIRISQNTVSAVQSVINIDTGGTIRINDFNLDAASKRLGTVNFNGGTLVCKAEGADLLNTGHTNWSGIAAYVLPGGAIIDSNGRNVTVKQALQSGAANDGGLTKKGTGTLSLRGLNLFNGGTVLWNGGLNITNDLNLGAVPAAAGTNLTFAGTSTFRAGASHAVHANRSLMISNSVTATFDTQGFTQTLYGVISGAPGSYMKKEGAGMLVIDTGADKTNAVSSLKTVAGTLVIARGTFNITTNAPGSQIYETLHINGGTLLVAGGTLRTTGGSYAMTQNGALLVTNGTANLNSVGELLNAYSGSGNTTVSGSGVLDLQTLRISQSGGSPDANVVNVNTGGVIRMQRFYIDEKTQSKGRVNFNGGTVVAKSTRGDFLGIVNTNWYSGIFPTVREGGAIIDSNGFDIDSKLPLYSGAASDGGLTKRGAGTFTLANTNTYNGVTSVEAGTLKLGVATNTLLADNTVRVSSNALLDVNGKVQTLAGLGGSGTVTNNGLLTVTSAITPGDANAVGTLTLASACSLSGALNVEIAANGACDRLHVRGDLDLSGLSLNVALLGPADKYAIHTVASCTDTLSGSFTGTTLPKDWLVRYDTANRRVYLIHQHGTLIRVR